MKGLGSRVKYRNGERPGGAEQKKMWSLGLDRDPQGCHFLLDEEVDRPVAPRKWCFNRDVLEAARWSYREPFFLLKMYWLNNEQCTRSSSDTRPTGRTRRVEPSGWVVQSGMRRGQLRRSQ